MTSTKLIDLNFDLHLIEAAVANWKRSTQLSQMNNGHSPSSAAELAAFAVSLDNSIDAISGNIERSRHLFEQQLKNASIILAVTKDFASIIKKLGNTHNEDRRMNEPQIWNEAQALTNNAMTKSDEILKLKHQIDCGAAVSLLENSTQHNNCQQASTLPIGELNSQMPHNGQPHLEVPSNSKSDRNNRRCISPFYLKTKDSYICQICKKSFANYRLVYNHIRMLHPVANASGDPNCTLHSCASELTNTAEEDCLLLSNCETSLFVSDAIINTAKPVNYGADCNTSNHTQNKDPVADVAAGMAKYSNLFLNTNTTYTCQICKQQFPYYELYYYHLTTFHPLTKINEERRENHNKSGKKSSSSKNHQPVAQILAASIDNNNPAKYSQFAGQGNRCEICLKHFSTKESLNRHIKVIHFAEKSYGCPVCHLKFGFKHHLDGHISAVHNKEAKFACHLCEKKFSQKYSLDRHTRYVHLGIKRVERNFCGTNYSRKDTSNRHGRQKHVQHNQAT